MSNDNKSNSFRAQEKKNKKIAREIERKRRQAQIAREKKKFFARLERENERKLKSVLKTIRGKGIYEPKGSELTKYRKNRLSKIADEFGDFFDPSKFVFISAPPIAKEKVLERSAALDLKTTKTGFFVSKEGAKNVKLKYDDTHKEFVVERSGKTKWGINQGKRYKSVLPLASLDELDAERDRIIAMAKKLGPLGKNDRIAFKISEQGNEGYSHATFNSIEGLLAHLDNYRKTTAARINFMRHIEIQKTEIVNGKAIWFVEHPVRPPKKFARRMHTSAYSKAKGR